eukprot:gnl/Chilomastix_caulleri/652.p1 GENE.gnl/Chilomastix_caulleri/652~~gnl/Chilomastix_caulleri/652.p1  ORF type:complete len:58 (+),score=16.78 gnl/Chilomastix_caulleri/652:35-208(+)
MSIVIKNIIQNVKAFFLSFSPSATERMLANAAIQNPKERVKFVGSNEQQTSSFSPSC